MVQNKALLFKAIPTGWPVIGEHLAVEDIGFDPAAELPEGAIAVKVNYVSFDPYQRGRMRDPNTASYADAFELGKPVTNRAISTVIKSANPQFHEGDVVIGSDVTPTAEYAVLAPEDAKTMRKLENPYNLDPKVFLGPLGMPGLTAYSSFYEIGTPKKGETIFVSAAAGAVGQLVGQLAKHEGLRVIGSVGDDAKLDFIVNELGFDGGFNYKKEKAADALARLAPDGIDIYYENVGGEQLEAAINHMNVFGRIIACGMISQYNLQPAELYPIRNLLLVVAKRIRMQGFIVTDPAFGPKYHRDHQDRVQRWIADGSFKVKLHVTEGIDRAAEGLMGLFEGRNFGKAVLEVAPLEGKK